jgi:hypothetical protein
MKTADHDGRGRALVIVVGRSRGRRHHRGDSWGRWERNGVFISEIRVFPGGYALPIWALPTCHALRTN